MVAIAVAVTLGAAHVRRVALIGAVLTDQPCLGPAIARLRSPGAVGPGSVFSGPWAGPPPDRGSRTATAAVPGAAPAVGKGVRRTATALAKAEEVATAGDLTAVVGAIGAPERHERKAAMAKRFQPTFHGKEPT